MLQHVESNCWSRSSPPRKEVVFGRLLSQGTSLDGGDHGQNEVWVRSQRVANH